MWNKHPWFLVSIKEILIKHWQTSINHCNQSIYYNKLKCYYNDNEVIYNKKIIFSGINDNVTGGNIIEYVDFFRTGISIEFIFIYISVIILTIIQYGLELTSGHLSIHTFSKQWILFWIIYFKMIIFCEQFILKNGSYRNETKI